MRTPISFNELNYKVLQLPYFRSVPGSSTESDEERWKERIRIRSGKKTEEESRQSTLHSGIESLVKHMSKSSNEHAAATQQDLVEQFMKTAIGKEDDSLRPSIFTDIELTSEELNLITEKQKESIKLWLSFVDLLKTPPARQKEFNNRRRQIINSLITVITMKDVPMFQEAIANPLLSVDIQHTQTQLERFKTESVSTLINSEGPIGPFGITLLTSHWKQVKKKLPSMIAMIKFAKTV